MKCIPFPSTESSWEYYSTAAIRYAAHLEKLYLSDKKRDGYDRLVSSLDQCLNLKNLTIRKKANKGIEGLNSIFRNFSSLKVLNVVLCHDWVEDLTTGDDMDLSLTPQKPGVKVLIVCALIHHDNSLIYIMHIFCGLQQLDITQNTQVKWRRNRGLLCDLWLSLPVSL